MNLNIVGYCHDPDCDKLIFKCADTCKFCKIHCILAEIVTKGSCPHGRPKHSKLGLNMAKFGSQVINQERDFFCKGCKWFIGYYSRIIVRKSQTQ